MYTKEEASKIRQQFWINFGQYMKPVPSAEGLPVNWINYKTGIKHVFFKMDVDKTKASIAIHIVHTSEADRKIYFQQFEAFKSILHNTLGEVWDWNLEATDENGLQFAKITKTLTGVNILNQHDWPSMISFLKPRIIALDEFWTDAKAIFEGL